MGRSVSFTLDFEDLRTSAEQPERVHFVTERLLDRLIEIGVKGTMFCVAETAARHPQLIARMVADGHEIGVHGLRHTPNDLLSAAEFRSEISQAKQMLEVMVGVHVVLYRAPQYSLIPETPWIPEILTDLGFLASSSVLPAKSVLYGWPGAPRTSFRWPSGLIELPSPVMKFGPTTIPYLGGAYLRLLPKAVRHRGISQADPATVLWSYCHPWEFDSEEPFYVFEDGGWLASRVGWMNRKGMMKRVEAVLSPIPGLPLGEIVAGLGELPIFEPSSVPREQVSRLQGTLRTRSRSK